MTSLLRRIALLETARQRHDAPAGPGLAAVLRWAETRATDQWWQELAETVSESPYVEQLQDQPGLLGLLQEARRWKEEHP